MMVAIWRARAVYAAAELNLADLIAGGRQTAGELADVTETHAGSIHRLLRALAACGVLTEVTTGCFALTPLGAALRSDAPGTARATVLTLGGDWQWKAWDKFLYSLRTGQPALRAAFGTSLFEYLVAHPEDGTRFNEAMIGIHGLDGPAVIAAYDFSSFKSVVDVGGGTGMLLTTILHSHESLRGTLFELPQTAPEARRLVEARGLSHRCDVIAGDFFEELPHGHDAYILAHVLHDWTDEQALPILRHCRRAIADDGRLLILESVLPPGDTPHQGKLMDLLMLTVTGGLERAAEEFATLLAAAEFKLTQAIPTSTHQTILEAVPMKRSTIVHGL
jgi:SAM-dependent methyltransferase